MEDIRTIRLRLGMTQIALANALGLNQSTISKLEGGTLTVDVRTELALEALLARSGTSGPPHRCASPDTSEPNIAVPAYGDSPATCPAGASPAGALPVAGGGGNHT